MRLTDEVHWAPEQLAVRHIAQEGGATSRILLSRATLVPTVCVTAEGVWWHPVGATDGYRCRGDVLAASFPWA